MKNQNAIATVERALGINQFRVNLNASVNGTSLKGHISAVYSRIVEVFGEPIESLDGYKVTGEWIFEDDNGNVFTLYDWKSTCSYDDELPTIDQFRACKERQEFNVGGHNSSDEFIQWLNKKLNGAE